MKYIVEKKTLQDVLNYLAGRPYAEVHTMVKQIQSSTPIGSEEPEQAPQEPQAQEQAAQEEAQQA